MPLYPPIPAATSSVAGAVLLDSTATDYTPIATATTSGVSTQAARADHAHADPNALPADFAWIAWTADPANANSTTGALVSQTVYLAEFFLRKAATLTNVLLTIVTAGSGLTGGQSFAGLYDSAGTRQAVTADQAAAWASTGPMTIAFTGTYAAAVGRYYIAVVSGGTTPPAFRASTAAPSMANTGMAAASLRFAIGATAQSTLPSTLTPSSYTGTNAVAHCAVVS